MKTILIIDDEADIRAILSYNLKKEGFTVYEAENGSVGISLAKKHSPDLILLDVMMPEMDGIEVCQELKSNDSTKEILICFLTARNEDYSQIAGLNTGGDDYVSKPVKPKVLISRINAILRRSEKKTQIKETSGNSIYIDREKYHVVKNNEQIHLPRKEFELFALLASKPGHVFEREYILERVWGTGIVVGDRTIDVHIRKLREKIGSEYIRTIKGVGYTYQEL